jgi:hypothetical protein
LHQYSHTVLLVVIVLGYSQHIVSNNIGRVEKISN